MLHHHHHFLQLLFLLNQLTKASNFLLSCLVLSNPVAISSTTCPITIVLLVMNVHWTRINCLHMHFIYSFILFVFYVHVHNFSSASWTEPTAQSVTHPSLKTTWHWWTFVFSCFYVLSMQHIKFLL